MSTRTALLVLGLVLSLPAACLAARAAARNAETPFSDSVPSRTLTFGDSRLRVYYDPQSFKAPEREINDWILRSARSAAGFFGRFPVNEVSIAIQPGRGRGIQEGEATADPKPRIRIVLGRDTSVFQLKRDSTMVHEMAHLGFPDIDDTHLWLHEGFATYVESIARAQLREVKPAEVWGYFTRIMAQGLPAEDEKRGLDRTRDEDRRYYGGALYWLTADIEIRKRTNNKRGVQDAIRAILAAGGSLSVEWTPERALRIGDQAVGVPVLVELFATWRKTAVSPDLDNLWKSLGVARRDGRTVLVNEAPLAHIRNAITAQPVTPILLKGPAMLYEATRRP